MYSFKDGIFVPPAQRGLGLVFQSYALWPHLTVFQNVSFGLELAKMPKAQVRQRVMAILADLQMGGLEDRYPQEMSGGQQQRVALARMLAPSPGIFLLDEPLSNLDARLRVDMRSELKRLHKDRGATTVYVTHDQLEALTMSTKIAVMKAGKLQQLASPTEVYCHPANIFVADFIGTPKVNLLEATATPSAEGTTIQVADVRIGDLPGGGQRAGGGRHPAGGHPHLADARARWRRVQRLLGAAGGVGGDRQPAARQPDADGQGGPGRGAWRWTARCGLPSTRTAINLYDKESTALILPGGSCTPAVG